MRTLRRMRCNWTWWAFRLIIIDHVSWIILSRKAMKMELGLWAATRVKSALQWFGGIISRHVDTTESFAKENSASQTFEETSSSRTARQVSSWQNRQLLTLEEHLKLILNLSRVLPESKHQITLSRRRRLKQNVYTKMLIWKAMVRS